MHTVQREEIGGGVCARVGSCGREMEDKLIYQPVEEEEEENRMQSRGGFTHSSREEERTKPYLQKVLRHCLSKSA